MGKKIREDKKKIKRDEKKNQKTLAFSIRKNKTLLAKGTV